VSEFFSLSADQDEYPFLEKVVTATNRFLPADHAIESPSTWRCFQPVRVILIERPGDLNLLHDRLPCFLGTQLLSVGGTFSDSDLAQASRLTQLSVIDLSSSNISDDGLRSLRSLTSLAFLDLYDCTKVTGSGLDALGTLPELTCLSLNGTSVTDEMLQRFAERFGNETQIVSLDLSRTRITDAALDSLARIASLKSVSLLGTEVSWNSIAEFRRKRPDVEVDR
jgi:hypothetical protein